MNPQSIFLIVAALGLTPIALSYGYAPIVSLDYLFAIDATPVNVSHIFRAVMGLYLALVLFWLSGAMIQKYRLPALYSLVIFMLGLAAGRVLSLVVDGIPHWLLIVYLVLEVGFGMVGIKMIRNEQSKMA
ncbi:DUF4345 domain-containing protein [Vibrio fortis]|uniref:DUF4345 domain-containing protein n=1 Tax=Vibrio fortis TaxID=212667 RepID=UPI0036F3A63A